MSQETTNRTAILRIRHHEDSSIFSDVTLTQSAPALTTQGTPAPTTTVAPTTNLPNPPGPPSGCHLAGTEIEMADGTFKLIENLSIGDEVRSTKISGLSEDENAWLTWSSPIGEFGSNESTSQVTSISTATFNAYRNLNDGLIKITYEHPLLSQKDGVVAYRRVHDIAIGDTVFYKDKSTGNISWLPITSNVKETLPNDALFTTYLIDVENEDAYFANGILAHNTITGEGPGEEITKEDPI